MRAEMKIGFRGSRFADAFRRPGEVVATDGDDGTPISGEEMSYHLKAGHVRPLRGPAPEIARPSAPEKAVLEPPEPRSDFACPQCGAGPFKNRAGLKRHVTTKHR